MFLEVHSWPWSQLKVHLHAFSWPLKCFSLINTLFFFFLGSFNISNSFDSTLFTSEYAQQKKKTTTFIHFGKSQRNMNKQLSLPLATTVQVPTEPGTSVWWMSSHRSAFCGEQRGQSPPPEWSFLHYSIEPPSSQKSLSVTVQRVCFHIRQLKVNVSLRSP